MSEYFSNLLFRNYLFMKIQAMRKRDPQRLRIPRFLIVVLVPVILFGINRAFPCHLITGKIFIVGCDLVNQCAVRQNFHDPVGRGLHELVVVAGEQGHAGKLDQPVVMDSISKWLVGSSRIRQLAPLIIILERRHLTFSPPERILTFLTPSSPAKSILPRKPRT